MDFNKIERLVPDQISMNHTNTVFNLGFRTGDTFHGFALLPMTAKILHKMLTEQVGTYEKTHGTIDISDAQGGIESPLQIL